MRLRATLVAPVLMCVFLGAASANTKTEAQVTSDSDFRDLVLGRDDPVLRFLPRHLAQRPTPRSIAGAPGMDVELGGTNEATIVVNPTDPLNIAYASLIELRVSTDGGATWADPVPSHVPSTHVTGGDPSVAFDSGGRLFWSYLGDYLGPYFSYLGLDLFVARCDPTTGETLPGFPVNVSEQIGVPGSGGLSHDKEWLAVDRSDASPYTDRLYMVWTQFPVAGEEFTVTSFSSDHGLTWSSPLQIGVTATGHDWPSHITVAPNGDVYVAYHRQRAFLPGTNGFVPNGTSGRVRVYRSTDGGVTFPQASVAYGGGDADMTWNVQAYQGTIPGAEFLLLGSVQPWILADPSTPGRVYVVASDDPNNDPTSGDPADVFIVISTDHGQTWTDPARIDSGPGETFQVLPTATIDEESGAIVVHYYDNRNGAVNADGNFLLDVFATVSLDGGMTFGQDFQINDTPFDPDAGARCRYNCGPFMTDVWASPDSSAYAVSGGGHFLRYDGASWSEVAVGSLSSKHAVWGSSDTDVYLCGPGGQILHYDGVQVISHTSGTSEDLHGLDGRADDDIFAVGANGTIVHYDGVSWSSFASGTTEELHDVWANPTGDLFVTGRNGLVLRCDGGGCLPVGALGDDDLGGIWGSSDSNVYAVSWTGGLFRYDGADWETLESGLEGLYDIWGSAQDDIIATGWGQFLRFNGASWTRESVTEHFAWKIDGSSASNVFTGGEHAFLAHYDGVAWTRHDNPRDPLFPTLRAGEYNGIASAAGRTFAVWCGNTEDDFGEPLDQQTIFDAFDTPWQVGISLVDLAHASSDVVLEPGRPNPSNGSATFAYSLPGSGQVSLVMFDVRGRRVATLIRGQQPAGRHVVPWNGRDGAGDAVAPGVYLLRLEVGQSVRTQKVVLTR